MLIVVLLTFIGAVAADVYFAMSPTWVSAVAIKVSQLPVSVKCIILAASCFLLYAESALFRPALLWLHYLGLACLIFIGSFIAAALFAPQQMFAISTMLAMKPLVGATVAAVVACPFTVISGYILVDMMEDA